MENVKWDGKTDSDIILEALLLLIDEEDEEKGLTTSYGDFGKYLQKLYKAAGAGNGKYSIRTNKKVSVILHKKQVQYELTWNKAAKLIHEYLHRKEK